MKKIKNFFSRWYVQMFLALLTVIMGYTGYSVYYRNLENPMTPGAIRIQSFFSMLKLFTLGFDVDNKAFQSGQNPLGQKKWVLYMLQTARFIGLFLTGTTLFKVLSSHISRLKEQIGFFLWDLKHEKLMLIGSNDENCSLYRSADKKYSGLIVCDSGDIPEKLSEQGLKCVHSGDAKSLLYDQIKKTIQNPEKKNTIIINTKNEKQNLSLSRTAIESINSYLADDIAVHSCLHSIAENVRQIKDRIRKETEDAENSGSVTAGAVQYQELIKKMKTSAADHSEFDEVFQKILKIEEKLNEKAGIENENGNAAELTLIREEITVLCTQTDQAILRTCIPLEKKIIGMLDRIRIVVFADREYQAIYRSIQQGSFCPIRCLNKYTLTAADYVSDYPLTRFIPDHERKDEILTPTGRITKESEFNMILVGFGDTNQEILLTSFGSNQFMQYDENGNPELKPVRYHIFDRNRELNEKNLNHNMFRYKKEFLDLVGTDSPGAPKETDYILPLYEYPADISFYRMDINNEYFYNRIREICIENPLSINHIVIAVSDDMSNIDLAQRLAEKKNEWGLKNLYIFTKVRDPENEKIINVFSKGDYISFGNEAFTLDVLLEDEIEHMASLKSGEHLRSGLSVKYPFLTEEEQKIHSAYEWLTMDHTMHMSNLFNFIGLRLKLNLIGFDYEKQKDGNGSDQNSVSLQEFADRYSEGDPALGMSEETGLIYSFRDPEKPEDFSKDITRKNLAVQEHYRWNGFMIMSGFIPGTIDQIKQGKTKDYSLRYHTNITTWDGLFKFRKTYAEAMNISEQEADVIRYDYLLMDGTWAYLNRNGYKIIRTGSRQIESGINKSFR